MTVKSPHALRAAKAAKQLRDAVEFIILKLDEYQLPEAVSDLNSDLELELRLRLQQLTKQLEALPCPPPFLQPK